ncbi:MAG: hypothetical protein KDJ15_00050 [Alphaproteobacteria bacterium]|nr:hypothetical protein [Alphaproteobacteria bacterium]
MPQENAVPFFSENACDALFTGLRGLCAEIVPEESFPSPGAFEPVFDALLPAFRSDCARAAEAGDLLFGRDLTAFGARTTALFTRWEDEGGGPSLPALAACVVVHEAMDPADPAVKALFLAAFLAEIPNDQTYHGNEHYRKVFFHAVRLAITHNQLFTGTPDGLSARDMIVLLIAACIHDLGHTGGDNVRDGVYTPGYLEQRSCDIARPYFVALGLEEDMIGAIETIVFCTDITFFAGENSPCLRMKKIYKHYFWDGYAEDVSLMMMGKLRRYEDNPRLVMLAMFLHEADIASSAGMSYEWTIRETIKFMDERQMRSAGPKVVLAFLREQLGETLFTEAGKTLYAAVMQDVIRQAEEDILSGRETYYE